ncbi:MAG TPA: site-specific integrase [Xanthomonadaceae bacterium]|uniref:Site-specific integrase n=1 Tax=Lysobacter hankyongensis TaxID=1176535 RepID=A0ABP9BI14_9GAMM
MEINVTDDAVDDIDSYMKAPKGVLILADVRIGRMKVGKMVIQGADAAQSALDVIRHSFENTRRVRTKRLGTRHADALPLGSPARMLSVEIADYVGHLKRRRLKKDTIDAVTRTLRVLLAACGDTVVSNITTEHIYLAWDLLTWASPGDIWELHLKSVPPEDMLAQVRRPDGRPAASKTLEKHRRFLTTFFKKLQTTGAIYQSPMAGFGKLPNDLRRPANSVVRYFSEQDLKKIFEPGTFIPWAKKYPHRWWCPILALYTGARINEVAQLKLCDVFEKAGRWWIAIQITDDAEAPDKTHSASSQSLKGVSAIRTIPIHPRLQQAGFLEFVQDMHVCGHERLFPNLPAGTNKETKESNRRYGSAIGRQFGAYLKDLKFGVGIGFHAFRHVFITHLSKKRVHDGDLALLTGHSKGNDYPVLQVYKHPDEVLDDQAKWDAIVKFTPDVEVPKYRKGQFREALSDPSKFYPPLKQ